MDIAVLPNNNHPEKFLQLDVGMLPATHGMFQIGAAVMSRQRQWHNRMYSQVNAVSIQWVNAVSIHIQAAVETV